MVQVRRHPGSRKISYIERALQGPVEAQSRAPNSAKQTNNKQTETYRHINYYYYLGTSLFSCILSILRATHEVTIITIPFYR